MKFLKLIKSWGRPLLCILLAGMILSSCRGYFSEEPAIDLVPNLDVQPKQKAQSESRLLPEGTVPYNGDAYEDSARERHGIVIPGDYLSVADVPVFAEASVTQAPLPFGISYTRSIPYAVDKDFVMRGGDRFNIYCAVCHLQTGTGKSIIMSRGVGFPPPPDFADAVVRNMTDGELFNIITHGRRNMRGYATQIPIEDRWAIVSYVRALQYARNGSINDVSSSSERERLQKEIREIRAASAAATPAPAPEETSTETEELEIGAISETAR